MIPMITKWQGETYQCDGKGTKGGKERKIQTVWPNEDYGDCEICCNHCWISANKIREIRFRKVSKNHRADIGRYTYAERWRPSERSSTGDSAIVKLIVQDEILFWGLKRGKQTAFTKPLQYLHLWVHVSGPAQ
jgi:hypothetical protein